MSPALVRRIYAMALRRKSREEATEDLRMMNLVQVAIASVLDKKGQSAYKRLESALRRTAEQEDSRSQQPKARRLVALSDKLRRFRGA